LGFKENPIPHLDFKNRNPFIIDAEYNLMGIEFRDNSDYYGEIMKCFPEFPEDGWTRSKMLINR
jgi:hypothetical protein